MAKLIVNSQFNKSLGTTDFRVTTQAQVPLFYAAVLHSSLDPQNPHGNYVAVEWDVRRDLTKEAALQELVGFHEQVMAGDYQDKDNRGPIGIMINSANDPNEGKFTEDYSSEMQLGIEALANGATQVKEHPNFANLALLRVNSPRAAYTIEDLSGPWKPETGKLTVMSAQDLSAPLAAYIARTAKVTEDPARIEAVLRNDVYGRLTR